MSCNPKRIDNRQVSPEQIAFRIVCCGEHCCLKGDCRDGEHVCCTRENHTCEDSWATFSLTAEDRDAKLAEYKAMIAARHEQMKAWREQK